ncbi:MAG TPA: ATP-binding protein [Candidatus Limnocylindria bacterium]|nr:ATP-binding protein [Candidatus Limnocylindria bacterium]
MTEAPPSRPAQASTRLPFRSRLTGALLAASLLPLLAFGLIVLAVALALPDAGAGPPTVIVLAMLVIGLLSVPFAFVLAAEILRPLRTVAGSVDRVSSGDLSAPVLVPGDDELARLAESHNRLAADLHRRSQQVGRILEAIGRMAPSQGVEELAGRAGRDAARIFELIDATVYLGPASAVPESEIVPGETRPLRAVLRVGSDELGVLLGWLPATRAWARPDQDLFELFASEVAVALRNAELFARVEAQNWQLVELDKAKDEFLRGVSHNLQSPLTSIRAYAEQLGHDVPDRRLEIIAEQSQRLSRMVRQLLTVTRLESGAIRPRSEVVNLASRTRKAWEALGASELSFNLDDRSGGWLAIADADQLDQVLWALLDNARKYAARGPIAAVVAPEPGSARLRLSIADSGPGVREEDRARLFGRFQRGSAATAEGEGDGGSGLGLYVSRELCRAMGGDLVLEPAEPGRGATFSVLLPAERAEEG